MLFRIYMPQAEREVKTVPNRTDRWGMDAR
jgi:hypothetical protein